MSGYYSFKSIDVEKQRLRSKCALYKRSWELQKKKSDKLEKENTILKEENEKLKGEKQKLKEELEKIKQERDTYKGMVFKANRLSFASGLTERLSGRKRGGQLGHTGYGRKQGEHVDQVIAAYLVSCPDCKTPLRRVKAIRTHTVTDIPPVYQTQSINTLYTIERQWCIKCQKEVHAVPKNVFPQSKLGINLLTMICLWKYRFRLPVAKITELLKTLYGIKVSSGTIVYTLHHVQEWLTPQYEAFLTEIRGSPVKHADETGWRIGGKNSWCWAFVTPKATIYTIEESRGKGVAEKMLKDAAGVLVRDDYGAYQKLPLPQQSCWAHLLRKSHEAATEEQASREVKKLHKTLRQLFSLLTEDVTIPFNKSQREELYQWYKEDLKKIITTVYQSKDAKRIQTRVKNQYTNLLTALLYEDVPLTNNAAERAIRPFVVTRKISGGSQTKTGAKTHAINMSIIETIAKRKEPLISTFQQYILRGAAV